LKLFLFCFFIAISLFASDKSYSLDYIYVNANTGQSSGGHSAIRLGDIVYHFQYFPDKIFHIIREPWNEFRYTYGIQENRTIYIHQVRLSKESFHFLFDRMNEIYLYQKKELANLEKLENDFKIIESISKGDETVYLKAAGYFSSNHNRKGNYRFLKLKINSVLGPNYLLKRLGLIRSKLNNFKIPLHHAMQFDLSGNSFPKTIENFSTDYLEMLSLLKALEILFDENDLNSSGHFSYSENSKMLMSPTLVNQFSNYANHLEDEIIRLLQSKEENNGYPLLVTLARYLVVQKSLSDRKIFFLDSFGKNHFLVVGEAIQNKSFLAGIYRQISKEISNLFSNISNETLTEMQYTILEDKVNREREILYGLEESRAIRINFELMLPSKEESVYLYRSENLNDSVGSHINIYKANRDKYAQALQKKYSFNLFNKNCTTEIFHSLNSFFNEGEIESKEKLGGVIKGNDSLVFVPVYAYYAVKKEYRVTQEQIIPSLRTIILNKNSPNGILFSMRESSTLTSQFYKFNKEDSFFIFFTDDVIWQRPIYGFVNLLAGLGEFGLGLCIFPFDKGEHIVKGMQGVFFSGPELIFFNIRKGTFIYEGKTGWIESE
jgi:hypothetical protein